MASEKKVVLIFTDCDHAALSAASGPALGKLHAKGCLLSRVSGGGKAAAASGAEQGETLWAAAERGGFVVAGPDAEFDMCVLDAPADAAGVETVVAPLLEWAGRSTLFALVARDSVLFYGPGIAKGGVVDTALDFSCVAPTVAYVADFPVPADCAGPVAYAALKDRNYKLEEMRRLQTTIANMESAMERKARRPWDKHDCA